MIVLDTNAWIYMAEGASLRPEARRAIAESSAAGGIAVSAISCWEIALLARKGRIDLTLDIGAWLRRALSAPGIAVAPLTEEIAVDAATLPGDPHGDPADRFIIATARSLGAPLLTRDRAILRYGRSGHVTTLRC